jgi:DNA invertase Pin-like site-specific DNA recombinase
MLGILGAVAEFERDLLLERQREGIAKAKAKGKYRGRKRTIDPEKVRDGFRAPRRTGAAKELGIGRASIYRILAPVSISTPRDELTSDDERSPRDELTSDDESMHDPRIEARDRSIGFG